MPSLLGSQQTSLDATEMLSSLNDYLEAVRHGWTPMALLQVTGLSLAATVVVVLIALRQLLQPVDHAAPPGGKKWKLPPGPKGYPIIGNLLLYFKGSAAVSH